MNLQAVQTNFSTNQMLLNKELPSQKEVPVERLDETQAMESTCFSLKDLVFFHQQAPRNLSVDLSVSTFDDGFEISDLKKFVKSFLKNYPNQDDFWEIMNVNLVNAINHKFTNLKRVKVTLSLAPDPLLTFARKSTVDFQRGAQDIIERFHFIKEKYHVCQQSFQDLDLDISWKMKANPGRFDYPDYQWVNDTVEGFFKDKPISYNSWNAIKPQLEEKILMTYPSVESTNIAVTVNN